MKEHTTVKEHADATPYLPAKPDAGLSQLRHATDSQPKIANLYLPIFFAQRAIEIEGRTD